MRGRLRGCETMEENKFKCPLCKSPLSESKWLEIAGVWDAKKKFEEELKKQLTAAKDTKEKLLKEKKVILEKLAKDKEELKKRFESQFEKQKANLIRKAQEEAKKLSNKKRIDAERKFKNDLREAQKEFLEKGKEHEKKRTERLTESLKLKTEDWKRAMDQIKELKDQLKKGTTPKMEGLDLEAELVKELKQKFPQDVIERHGHAGDILHYVVCEGKKIALIVYECKKTQKFSKSYIKQIRTDVIKRNANYGVLVTVASDKDKIGFWVEKDIMIVHPFGAPYIAEVLRKSLIALYSLKLSDKELGERAKKLLEYIKGNKFRNSVRDNINRAKELYDILEKEVVYHKNLWEKRSEHYNIIAKQTKEIENDSKAIIGEDQGDNGLEVPTLILEPRKKKKIVIEQHDNSI